jgi:hypothetical protein
VDLSEAKLVDFSILENLYDFQRTHADTGGMVSITGLQNHNSSCNHKLSLKILADRPIEKLTRRQVHLAEIAADHDWNFNPIPVNNLNFLNSFHFFKTRPIELRNNTVTSKNKNNWEICDVLFEEGAYAAADEYQTTLCLINADKKIPKFVIEKMSFTDKYLNTSWLKDIDYDLYPKFSRDFIVKVKDNALMDAFLTEDMKSFIENSSVTHMESNGEAIMIFNAKLRLAQISDYSELVRFAEGLGGILDT